jgi:hypothetical protein
MATLNEGEELAALATLNGGESGAPKKAELVAQSPLSCKGVVATSAKLGLSHNYLCPIKVATRPPLTSKGARTATSTLLGWSDQ